MVDINRLVVFLNVAQTLNFSETAQYLHVSQPTVSKHIHDLERELGVQLFDRSGGKLCLTEAGQALLPLVRKLILMSSDIEKIAKSMETEVSGQLKIACTTSAGHYILPLLAARFHQRYPQARVTILACTQEEAASRLLEEEADLAVVSTEVTEEYQDFFTDYKCPDRTGRSYIAGRFWRPIYSTSRKPRVVTSAVRAPLRSSRAFVATVEP